MCTQLYKAMTRLGHVARYMIGFCYGLYRATDCIGKILHCMALHMDGLRTFFVLCTKINRTVDICTASQARNKVIVVFACMRVCITWCLVYSSISVWNTICLLAILYYKEHIRHVSFIDW